MNIVLSLVAAMLYLLLGLGAATAEAQARKALSLHPLTIAFWPIALLSWWYYGRA